jgi:hypothetical protein
MMPFKLLIALCCSMVILSACDSSQNNENKAEKPQQQIESQPTTVNTILPYLNIQERPAKLALPFCETKICIDIDVQTIETVDPWINQWVEKQQALVVQDQIGLKQDIRLQQAINAYIKASDLAQEKGASHPYRLVMYTRIPYQRNQYVLLQVGVNTMQNNIEIRDRYYFFVADRTQQKPLQLLSLIHKEQQAQLDTWVQDAYQKWVKEQSQSVQTEAPKKLYWGQADWFFDQEGIGFHYRSDEIVVGAQQLDIYLTKQQTQQVLKAAIYERMF